MRFFFVCFLFFYREIQQNERRDLGKMYRFTVRKIKNKNKKDPPPAKKRTMANGLVTLLSLLVSAFLTGGVTN